jgi:hypothetical protein
MDDVIVEEVRRVREELIEQYGGIDGYFKRCQAQERARTGRSKPKQRKQRTVASKKSRKAS